MLLPIVGVGGLYRDVVARVISRSILFSAKAICLGVPTLRGSVTVFVIFKALINSGAIYSSSYSPRLVMLEELVSVDNHVSVYGGGKFYY